MTVHQVEEYYIHVDTKEATKGNLKKIKKALEENNWVDYEFADDYIVVDGFESEMDAEACNEIVMSILQET